MKRRIPGLLAALLLSWFFPAGESLSSAWSRAWNAGATSPASASEKGGRPVFASVRDTSITASDTAPTTDPFHLEPSSPIRASASRSNLGMPPPPRPWKVTGRVGERAAVLANPDGRVVVVSTGAMVDSSRVVSIGPGGVVLEDRAGQFTLKIP